MCVCVCVGMVYWRGRRGGPASMGWGGKVWRKYASDKQTQQKQQHFYSPVYAKNERKKKKPGEEVENIEKRGTIRRRCLRREKQPCGEEKVLTHTHHYEGFPKLE